jgi:hypothetical protein
MSFFSPMNALRILDAHLEPEQFGRARSRLTTQLGRPTTKQLELRSILLFSSAVESYPLVIFEFTSSLRTWYTRLLSECFGLAPHDHDRRWSFVSLDKDLGTSSFVFCACFEFIS